MLGRISLYYHTVRHLRPVQIFYRVAKRFGLPCSLGVKPGSSFTDVQNVFSPDELDFDPVVLSRFSVEELMDNKITFLHGTEEIDWRSDWFFKERTVLWNFNLNYFEYLFPLVHEWEMSGDEAFLNKTIEIITGWISCNPRGSHPAWEPYTTALRIVSWIDYYSRTGEALPDDFRTVFLSSLHEQYVFLTRSLEKDILGNHYFEDLRSLVTAALFFKDEPVFERALRLLKKECKEEILPDGLHFELSPMYHKIVFEGMLRTAVALRHAGRQDDELEAYLQPMLNAAFSLEDGLERLPLFNDCGNNMAKSLAALMITAEKYFGLKPRFCAKLDEGGFYIFRHDINGHAVTLIVDAARPGPSYITGHAHCDAMSYELFCDGVPVVVNCGTYAYQCRERDFFRSTSAHNAVMADGVEQSQYWSTFRLAKKSSTRVIESTDSSILMEMTDQSGSRVKRSISLSDEGLYVEDTSEGKNLSSFIHLTDSEIFGVEVINGNTDIDPMPYSVDYGRKQVVDCFTVSGKDKICYRLTLGSGHKYQERKVTDDAFPGYKPLAFINGKLYLYSKGYVWTPGHAGMLNCVNFSDSSWKDRNRLLVRLFRREPRAAFPIDDSKMLVAAYRSIYSVDIALREVRKIYTARDGFSTPLNISAASGEWLALWGDYGTNAGHDTVNIYALDRDFSVETVYSFKPGQIRHVHNIVPRLSGGYYIFTGDQEDDAGIYTADADFGHVEKLKTGRQQYRAVVGFDTADGLLYATDAVNEPNFIYLLSGNAEPEIISPLNGSCIYGACHDGKYYFSTTVEPDENNTGPLSWISRKRGSGILSDEAELVEVDDNMKARKITGFRKDALPMKLFQYGSIQFPGGKGDSLWIYPVAVKEADGTALRIREIPLGPDAR